MRCSRWTALAVGALLSPCSVATAQGFGLNEISSCAIGRGFATTAAPCDDASYIFWNPAAGTQLRGTVLGGGGAALAVGGSFTADGTRERFNADVPVRFPPHLFISHRYRQRVAVGLGVYVPYGLTSQWGDDFPGRFLAQRASLTSIYAQPTIAVDLVPGTFSIGGGAIVTRSALELNQSLDLSQLTAQPASATRPAVSFGQLGVPAGTEFARARLEGNAIAYGFNLGALWRPAPSLAIGARYLSSVTVSIDDAAAEFTPVATNLVLPRGNPLGAPAGTTLDQLLSPQFAGTGALSTQSAATEITLPDQLAIGIAWTGVPETTLSADLVRHGWQRFQSVPLDFSNPATPDRTVLEDYSASWSVRGGAERRFRNGWMVRGGVSWTQSPAPDETVTPLLPDRDRRNIAVGVGVPLSGLGTRWRLDGSYLLVDTDDRRGRVVERNAPSQTAAQLNSGVYALRAHIASLTLRAAW
jgi:long-chain fatty acid transport protein